MRLQKKDKKMPTWAMPALSWIISFYFLLGFVSNVGFPPDRSLLVGDGVYVGLWLFFLFLPFFSKVKVGQLLELEREVERAKEDLHQFKSEIRNSLSVLSTTVNTIGSMTNQVTVNIPGLSELQRAREEVEHRVSPKAQDEANDLKRSLLLESEDTTMALARTRIEIERLLREILGKRTSVNDIQTKAIKFASARRLFDVFLQENERYSYLLEPFIYVMQVCNAAIHAQSVSDEQAKEALALGATIIATLSDFSPEKP
jgi:hypothetical protein